MNEPQTNIIPYDLNPQDMPGHDGREPSNLEIALGSIGCLAIAAPIIVTACAVGIPAYLVHEAGQQVKRLGYHLAGVETKRVSGEMTDSLFPKYMPKE